MDPKKILETQMQVRHNAEEIKSSISGIYNWTKDIKKQDEDLLSGNFKTDITNLPIRSHVESNEAGDNKKVESEKNIKKKPEQKTNSTEKRDAKEDQHKQANALKDMGNNLVKLGEHSKAIEQYTAAIQHYSEDPIYYSNRALCYLRLELYQECIEDCKKALDLDSKLVKAYYRLMLAHESLGDNEEALKHCTVLLKLDPKNVEAKRSLERINKRRSEKSIPSGPQFTPLCENMVDVPIITKLPHHRSKKPMKKVQITEICEFSVTDELNAKLHSNSSGPSVDIQKKEHSKPINKESITSAKQPNGKDNREKETPIMSTTPVKSIQPKRPPEPQTEHPLPPAARTTAQFYAAWKELTLKQKYEFLKSIPVEHLCKVTGAGFDSQTLTDILEVINDFYIPNHEPFTAETLYQLSTNEQIGILSMMMSSDDKKRLKEILVSLKGEVETVANIAQKIANNFNVN